MAERAFWIVQRSGVIMVSAGIEEAKRRRSGLRRKGSASSSFRSPLLNKKNTPTDDGARHVILSDGARTLIADIDNGKYSNYRPFNYNTINLLEVGDKVRIITDNMPMTQISSIRLALAKRDRRKR